MWAPRFTHNISLFYPEAILNYYGVTPSHPYYTVLITRVTAIIEAEVLKTAHRLNKLLKEFYRQDLMDIDEYRILPGYWMALESSLSSPSHIGVVWGKKVVQAKFVDTNILGGLKDLQSIQHQAYPKGTGNLGAWKSLYNRWLRGEDDSISKTLEKRIAIMLSSGSAPFAELIETGNDMYPAYPQHMGKHTLEHFKPIYRREMRTAYHKVVSLVRSLIPIANIGLTSVVINDKVERGYIWKSGKGNIIFISRNSIRLSKIGRVIGSGFILSQEGQILKRLSNVFLPR